MAEELNDDPQWEIRVRVPMRLLGHQRDEWDADVAGCPADEWPELVDLRASRQAWAEEAMRLEMADEARRCSGAHDCPAGVHHEGCFYSEAREESEEGSGRVDTGQAGREEAAEQTVGTGYPQGSGPGHGSATPAPLSSRPQCAVHPDGADGVTQTILAGDASGRLGNCLQAAVATLLGLPLEQVPHFAESEGDWVADMVAFARARGYRLTWRSKDEPPAFGLIFGPTVRSTELHHAVAIIGGAVWDPHPSRAGLTAESTFIDWVPVEGSVHPDGETA